MPMMMPVSEDAGSQEVLRSALQRLLIPGTDADVAGRYATLARRARESVFGAFEEDVVTLDVETTGLSYQRDDLIEVAAVRLRGNEVVDRFWTFVNPGRAIPAAITDLTSITDADVADAVNADGALSGLLEFIGQTTVVAHNADFDRNMLRYSTTTQWSFIEQNTWVDSIDLARIALPRCRSFGLQALSEAFCEEQSTHRAIDDALRLAELWRIMLTALGDLSDGLALQIATLFPSVNWPLRPHIAQVAGSGVGSGSSGRDADSGGNSGSGISGNDLPRVGSSGQQTSRFSLINARSQRIGQRRRKEKQDALELDGGRSGFRKVDLVKLEQSFTADGLLGQMYPHFETRIEQNQMASAVATALSTRTHLVVEAGTGVGKSMAYLLPLVTFAQANDICCGVATKTNALLDQLLYSELPRLDEALPGGVEFAALKGYSHYPCMRKLAALIRQSDRLIDQSGVTTVASLLSYVCQSSQGDLDNLRIRFDQVSRHEVAAGVDDCLKYRCSYHAVCLLHAARRHAAEADIVLTNQALLFSDIASDGKILPAVRFWVIDEAHGVEGEAREQLSTSISGHDMAASLEKLLAARGLLATMRDGAAAIEAGIVVEAATVGEVSAAAMLVNRIDTVLNEAASLPVICRSFTSNVKELVGLTEESGYDQVHLWINERIRETTEWSDVFATGASLLRKIRQLWEDCRDMISLSNGYDQLSDVRSDLSAVTSELNVKMESMELILNGDNPAYVYSAQLDRRVEQQADSLLASRIDVGEVLAELLYPQTFSVIYTSATLATGQSFDYFARSSGLARLPAERWSSLQLDSSYDFENNMSVFIPSDLPEPGQPGYAMALEELLHEVHVALGGSVLTLFTNRREMEELYHRLRGRLEAKGIEVRCQWSGSSGRRLAEEFLSSRELSLFALRSFWEGFDAPGETLRCVVIPKLPFGSPTDPLAQERSQRERDSWRRYALPEAIIDLRQAAGRLIRSSADRGALILADSRLLTKWYGPAFLNAMPSSRRYTLETRTIAEVLKRLGL
jgi:ATP-dependent DNA helicase DinG